jgi:hypothetical protein
MKNVCSHYGWLLPGGVLRRPVSPSCGSLARLTSAMAPNDRLALSAFGYQLSPAPHSLEGDAHASSSRRLRLAKKTDAQSRNSYPSQPRFTRRLYAFAARLGFPVVFHALAAAGDQYATTPIL